MYQIEGEIIEEECVDSESKVSVIIDGEEKKKTCSYFAKGIGSEYCEDEEVKMLCPVSCGNCDNEQGNGMLITFHYIWLTFLSPIVFLPCLSL